MSLFVGVGVPDITILRIENNTNEPIDHVNFTYGLGAIDTKLKNVELENIEPNSSKKTSVRTIYKVTDLKMIVAGVTKEYLIKSELPKGTDKVITISINSINSDNCDFDIQEEKREL